MMLLNITLIITSMFITSSIVYAEEPVKVRGDLTAFIELFDKKVGQIGDYGSVESISTIKQYVKQNNIDILTPKAWLGNIPPSKKTETLHSMLTAIPPDTVIIVALAPDCIKDDFSDYKLNFPINITPTYIKGIPIDLVEGVKYSYEDQPYRRLTSISKEPFKKALSSKKKLTWKSLGVKSPVFSSQELNINYRNLEVTCALWHFNDKKTMGNTVVNLGSIDRDTEEMGVFGGMVRNSEHFSANDGITAVIRHGAENKDAKNLIKQNGFQISASVYLYTNANPSQSVKRFVQLVQNKPSKTSAANAVDIKNNSSLKVAEPLKQKVESTASAVPLKPNQNWKGYYVCAQGTTDLNLTIGDIHNTVDSTIFNVDAVFDFKFGSCVGQFNLLGQYNAKNRQLNFSPGRWINNPCNYHTVGMNGVIYIDTKEYSGSIPGCKEFSLKLSQ